MIKKYYLKLKNKNMKALQKKNMKNRPESFWLPSLRGLRISFPGVFE